MPEGIGPGPENIEPNPDDDSEDPNQELRLAREQELTEAESETEVIEQLIEQGVEPDDIFVGQTSETMPLSLPPAEFFAADELVLGEDNRYYTKEGLLAEKVVARETFLQDHAVAYPKFNLLDNAFVDGMLVVKNDRVGVISELTLIVDPLYPKQKRPTLPHMKLTYPDGSEEETAAMGVTPVYQAGIKKLSEGQLAAKADQLQTEYGEKIWQVGQYVSLNAEPSYVGKIAAIPDQTENPGAVVVMFRDRKSFARLFLISLSDVDRPS